MQKGQGVYSLVMMFALRRLLLGFVIVLAGYCFWPRSPSLTAFDPQRMAELQLTIWKNAGDKNTAALVFVFYELYERQYHLPPISSLKMAFDTAKAWKLFNMAPDAADQEKALIPLETVFATLKSNLKASFDSSTAARMELVIWMLRADRVKRGELTSAWAESLALLHGRSTADCLPAAKKFSLATKLADDGKWGEAGAASLEGWNAIRRFAPAEK